MADNTRYVNWTVEQSLLLSKYAEAADALADALKRLLWQDHPECPPEGYCPDRIGREALARYEALNAEVDR